MGRVGRGGIGRDQGNRSAAAGEVCRERPNLGQLRQQSAVAHDDEVPALEVLRRPRPTRGLDDGVQVIVVQCLLSEAAHHAQAADCVLDLHRAQSRLGSAMAEKRTEDFPRVLEVVVEITSGSRNKYEFDEAAGVIRLDRVLSSAVFYNFDYGYIPGTRADDGDHTDAMVLLAEPTLPGLPYLGTAGGRAAHARRETRRLQGPVRSAG